MAGDKTKTCWLCRPRKRFSWKARAEPDAHNKLAFVLEERAEELEAAGGDPEAAAALYDECARLWGVCKGQDHEWTMGARAKAARLRKQL